MNMRTEIVYLYHFGTPLHHAQHYLGSCVDLEERDGIHQAGLGAKILRAAKAAGITFWVVRTWPGGRQLERKLKNRHNAAKLCPICQAKQRKNQIPDDVDFYGMLDELRSGKVQPAAPFTNEQLETIEDEAIGQDYSERPYLY